MRRGAAVSLLLLAHGASTLVVSGRCTRRGAIAGALALGSLPTAAPVHAENAAVQAAVAAREAAEAAERDPLNRLKAARATLASVTDKLSGENPDLGVVRAALSPAAAQRIAGNRWEIAVEGVAYAVRTYTKEVVFKEGSDVGPLRVQLLAQIKDIDQIVYDNQAKSPSAISGVQLNYFIQTKRHRSFSAQELVDCTPN